VKKTIEKTVSLMVVGIVAISMLVACGASTPATQPQTAQPALDPAPSPEPALEPEPEPEPEPFVLEYPADMRSMGFTDPLILDIVPNRVAIMSVGAVMTLYNLGVGIVAVPTTGLITYPDTLDVPRLPSAMADDFDIEMVVSLDPDLVVMPMTLAETHGATLQMLGIPVYFVMAGHVVPYDSIRMQTSYFIEAFGNEENADAGQAMEEAFDDLENYFAVVQERAAGMTVMVLQGNSHIQTSMALLGSMLEMLGFTNVSEMPGSLVMIDFEQALYYDPDWVFAVGSAPTAEEHQAFMEASFADNQSYWDSIPAIYDGRIIYLPMRFVSSAGIAIVDIFNELIEIVDGLLGEQASD